MIAPCAARDGDEDGGAPRCDHRVRSCPVVSGSARHKLPGCLPFASAVPIEYSAPFVQC